MESKVNWVEILPLELIYYVSTFLSSNVEVLDFQLVCKRVQECLYNQPWLRYLKYEGGNFPWFFGQLSRHLPILRHLKIVGEDNPHDYLPDEAWTETVEFDQCNITSVINPKTPVNVKSFTLRCPQHIVGVHWEKFPKLELYVHV